MLELVFNIIVFSLLLYMSFQDIKKQSLSVISLIILALVSLVGKIIYLQSQYNIFQTAVNNINEEVIQDYIYGILIGITVFIIGIITGMLGAADGIIFIILGAVYGGCKLFGILYGAFVLMAIVALAVIVVSRKNLKYKIPFVPFITMSYVGVILM